ncbi:hypothetical protein [Natronorubrum daqingense]|uniref:Uncharacterized protein n=1 Tax=Natronorubrum daqingense TaxID=588898 RepID=A0A1N6ZDQ8_9EURY|nr:hypothetical protein [Natronorubrum daqingense]APX95382.1 hypothetical protein BB347_01445 [Natronorubrum daqingense]SIR24924.1 hypothetical protein SAMN05421809_0769 [Natronorubrum daqingense]
MDSDIILKDEADSLEQYCQSLKDLTHLQEFEETYTVARRTAKTWTSYGQYLPSELLSTEYRWTRIECGRFFVYSFSILEDIYPKLLAQELGEKPKKAENYLSGISKAQLEELLYHFGIIDGKTKHELGKIRKRRNTFAHGHDPQENYFGDIDLLSAIDRRYNVISDFIERVYDNSLPDIANYVSKCYEVPIKRHDRLQDYATAQLLKIYRDLEPEMAAFPSGFQEEVREDFEEIMVPLPINIEEELERRGYDPTTISEVVPPARRPLELKSTEYSIDDTYIDITLTDYQELIGWDHNFELSFHFELLNYYAYNGKRTEKPPKQATALLLMDGTIVDTEQISPVPEVGTRWSVKLSYHLGEEFYATPTVPIRYGIIVEGEDRYHMSIRDESILNMVPVSREFTEAKSRLHGLTVNDQSREEVINTLRNVRSKLRYIEQTVNRFNSDVNMCDVNNLEEMDKDEILEEIEELSGTIEDYHRVFGLDKEQQVRENNH